ncbi:Uncharacterised protein [Yersinia frederiksenii]|nr:Uncharacterised protein [Yersinia frederiksenii]CNH68275.1 Uncharacterised protein [Yersinia frederiksenii]
MLGNIIKMLTLPWNREPARTHRLLKQFTTSDDGCELAVGTGQPQNHLPNRLNKIAEIAIRPMMTTNTLLM